MNRPISI